MTRAINLGLVSGALALALAFPASSDEWADSVESFTLPPDCNPADPTTPVPGGNCSVSDDNNDGGVDATGPDVLSDPDNTRWTALGWDSDGTGGVGDPVGGELTVNFDDNLCLNGSGDDLVITEGTPGVEDYDVYAGLQGDLLAFASSEVGDASIDVGDTFNQVKFVATGGGGNLDASGVDVRSVSCASILDQSDIIKTNTGFGFIDAGGDVAQGDYSFTIEVKNTTGEAGLLDGLVFADSVPGEFDLDPNAEDLNDQSDDNSCLDGLCDGIDVTNLGNCILDVDRPNGAKRKGGTKLEPELISLIPDGLNDGDSCIIEVFAITDGKTFPNGRSPAFAPTSCVATSAGDVIALNNGVVVEDDLGNVLLEDDDQILLDCTQL